MDENQYYDLLFNLGMVNYVKEKEKDKMKLKQANVNIKDNQIIVYCKSGKRSSEAKKKLEELGYSRVYDLGSIDNWKE